MTERKISMKWMIMKKQEKNILWENKNQGPEGNDNETRKEKGLD